jgi:predicted DNA-binding antitoxin AbrB/MazE fold protein
MTRTIEAIYENGILRPVAPIEGLEEHARVRVSIEEEKSVQNLLKACGTVSDEDTLEIQRIIEQEFEQVGGH